MLISALHEQSQKFEGSKKTSKPVHENDFEMSSYTSSRMTGKSRLQVALSFETAGTADVAACSGRDRGSSFGHALSQRCGRLIAPHTKGCSPVKFIRDDLKRLKHQPVYRLTRSALPRERFRSLAHHTFFHSCVWLLPAEPATRDLAGPAPVN